jgi:hypothetical protein
MSQCNRVWSEVLMLEVIGVVLILIGIGKFLLDGHL